MSTSPISCPKCGDRLEDDGRFAGQLVKCPNCSTEFRMPGGSNPYQSPIPVTGAADEGRIRSKVTIVQICMVVGGVVALSVGFGLTITLIGLLWPGTYYSYLVGLIAIYKGATMMSRSRPPRGTAVMQILNIVSGDLVNVCLGAAELILLNDPEVEAWFARRKY